MLVTLSFTFLLTLTFSFNVSLWGRVLGSLTCFSRPSFRSVYFCNRSKPKEGCPVYFLSKSTIHFVGKNLNGGHASFILLTNMIFVLRCWCGADVGVYRLCSFLQSICFLRNKGLPLPLSLSVNHNCGAAGGLLIAFPTF